MVQSRLLAQLNPPQRAAVMTESGPLLVLAGAGTGKTRVVTYRIARLISRGIAPERILAVTFTNKAAGEMLQRVRELRPGKDQSQPEISTFHSLCVRILRRQIQRLGYPERFAIYDSSEQDRLARKVLREINVPGTQLRPGDLLSTISGWKSRAIRPEQALSLAASDREHLAAIAYRRYQRSLKASAALDFDDLLLCTEDLFRESEEARVAEAARFDHILIDEYQDTNETQYRIVRSLAAAHRNLCVVGDDDQSIYGWRGAEVKHILGFRKDWPDARVVRLEDNYRCTGPILELANRLIRFNTVRHDKTLRAAREGGEKPKIRQFADETKEAEETVADIARRIARREGDPSDFAVLFRTNEQPRLFEDAFRRANVPYVLIGGMSFYDRKEVRDLLSYLRVLVEPTDEPAMLRIMNTPPRGISETVQQALLASAVGEGQSVWEVLPRAHRLPDVSERSAESVQHFVSLVKSYRQRIAHESIAGVVKDLVRDIGYIEDLQRRYANDPDALESRSAAVEEVINAVAEYEKRSRKPTLVGFLDDLMLSNREQERDKEKQLKRSAVILMTLHSAKGLEFPQVYLVGMEEGLLPHRRSVAGTDEMIDEERRLCYVGITRAQDRLTFSFAHTRRKWGKPRETIPSRFLFELTGQSENARDIAKSH